MLWGGYTSAANASGICQTGTSAVVKVVPDSIRPPAIALAAVTAHSFSVEQGFVFA